MNTAHNLDHAREALDRAIHDRRRDRVDLALSSAACLLDISPESLWRRLAVAAGIQMAFYAFEALLGGKSQEIAGTPAPVVRAHMKTKGSSPNSVMG